MKAKFKKRKKIVWFVRIPLLDFSLDLNYEIFKNAKYHDAYLHQDLHTKKVIKIKQYWCLNFRKTFIPFILKYQTLAEQSDREKAVLKEHYMMSGTLNVVNLLHTQ